MDSARIFFKIGEVAKLLEVKPSVLRFWETSFSMLTPEKGENGQRVYRRTDIETLMLIQDLLYNDGYSIDGARKKLRELRRQGLLKEMRESCAAKRGFRPQSDPQPGGAPSGAEAAGPAVPLEVMEQPVRATNEKQQVETERSVEISALITEVRSLQASLRRSPRSA